MNGRSDRLIGGLAVLLLVQLWLGWWLASGDEPVAQVRTELLSFAPAAVDRIEISDADGRTLQLQRRQDGWQLPGEYDFPAAQSRVAALLEQLAGLRPGLAVATSAEAARRFRVAADGFERRIRLLGGEKELATLYLGDAAGPRRAYGRAARDTAIYPVEFTAFDAGTAAGEWTDKTYLHRDTRGLTSVALGGLVLQRVGDDWQLAELGEGELPDTAAAGELVARLTGLDFMAVHGRKAAAPAGEPLLDAQLRYADGTRVDYRFIDPGQDGDPLLVVSDRDHVLRIGSYALKPLLEVRREDLLRRSDEDGGPRDG